MTHYSRGVKDQKLYTNLRDAISGDCILLTGCGLLLHTRTDGEKSPPTSWDEMVRKMIDWCELRLPIGNEKNVDEREKLKDIRRLMTIQELEEVERAIEKYLADKILLQQCLRSVLLYDQAKVSQIYRHIVNIPFRAYLTTSYDTFIEDAYLLVHGHRINTFTGTSMHIALEEYRERRPFVLKLHGDIDNPASINLTDRLYKQRLSSTNGYRDGLQLLISRASVLITGFEKADSEVKVIETLLHEFREPISSSKQWILVPKEQSLDLRENEEISIIQYPYDEKHTNLLHFFEKLESFYNPKAALEKNKEAEEKKKQEERKSINIAQQAKNTEIFISHAHVEQDENILKELITQLKTLDPDNTTIWSDLDILPGTDGKQETQKHLYAANIILLLVSAEFIQEMEEQNEEWELPQIMNRQRGEGIPVIPIIIRATNWSSTSFGKLKSLPRNKKPVSIWPNQDEALTDVARGIQDTLINVKKVNVKKEKVYPPLRLISPSTSSPDEVS